MSSRYRINLTFSILASLAALLLLTWILLSIISFKIAEKDLVSAKAAHALLMAKIAAALVPDRPAVADMAALAATLGAEKDFAGLLVAGAGGEELFRLADGRPADPLLRETIRKTSASSQVASSQGVVFSYAPLVKGGSTVGALRLTMSLGSEYALLARSRSLFIGYFILDFILLLGLGAFLLRRIIVNPLERLLKATERVIAGDYGHQLHLPGSAEIAGLADSFNLMQITLKERRDEVETHLQALQASRLETLRSEKMASVGLLAAGMAHEIGTPLAGIIGYSGILAEELAGDAEKSDYLRRITEDAGRIDRLVKDLLNYARPVKPEIERIDVREFLEDLFAMLERQGLFKKLQPQLALDESLPTLYLDRHQLLQVMMNLVINARDAMPDGGVLSLAARCGEGEALLLEVADSGAGIEPENMEKIFEPFFTTKEPGRGTGLGLAISARLVESFGGRITVASKTGEGARFSVWLPAVFE
ncbi:MAG: HAMP domain-containing protein [Geobacter sp.]|nr:HAMP domain-containing protein [Geobacter sp.]